MKNKKKEQENMTQYFSFGNIYTTSSVNQELDIEEVIQLLEWHGQLKRGELCDEDVEANRLALKNRDRILSKYRMNGQDYYVITEWDRTATTILKSEEY